MKPLQMKSTIANSNVKFYRKLKLILRVQNDQNKFYRVIEMEEWGQNEIRMMIE